jgi:hypothetical protein
MRLFLALALFVPGLLMLASPGLPVGLLMMWGGWWVYERSRLPDRGGLEVTLMVLAGLGAGSVFAQAAWEAFTRLP